MMCAWGILGWDNIARANSQRKVNLNLELSDMRMINHHVSPAIFDVDVINLDRIERNDL